MEENKLLLSEFVNDEGFELSRYITQLFECVSTLSTVKNTTTKPAQ